MCLLGLRIFIVKKVLFILGAICLMLVVLIAAAVGFVAVRGSALDKESKAYIDKNVPVIFSNWDAQALWRCASPEFMQTTTQAKLVTLFAGLSHKFGKMQAYEGSDGQTYISDMVLSRHDGEVIRAVYTARVAFDAGPANIKVTLIKGGERWQIEDLNIKSSVLLQH